jgi:phage/plasmid-associated DNA primase
MILMPFRVTIAADDPGRVRGMDKPAWWVASGELPGILNWALAGLDRLRRQNRFTTARVCEEAHAEYRTESIPARIFLTESCCEKPGGQVSCLLLYQAYGRWCQDRGYSPLADRGFGKEVARVFPKAERKKVGPRDNRVYCYCGIDNVELSKNLHQAEVMRRHFEANATGQGGCPEPG